MPAELTQSVLEAFQKAKDSQAESRVRKAVYETAITTRQAAQDDEAKTLEESNTAHAQAVFDAEAAVKALKSDLEI